MPVSFARDIVPLYTTIDVDHMKPLGVLLVDYGYISDPNNGHAHANAVLSTPKIRACPGWPFRSQAELDLFTLWVSEGYNP